MKSEDLIFALNATTQALRLTEAAAKPFTADPDELGNGSKKATSLRFIKNHLSDARTVSCGGAGGNRQAHPGDCLILMRHAVRLKFGGFPPCDLSHKMAVAATLCFPWPPVTYPKAFRTESIGLQ